MAKITCKCGRIFDSITMSKKYPNTCIVCRNADAWKRVTLKNKKKLKKNTKKLEEFDDRSWVRMERMVLGK